MCVEASDGCAGEAIEAKVPVAVCSTSNERAVSTIVRVLLGPEAESKMRVFAGDIVKKKKPSPDIYNLAASELKVDPSRSAPLTWLHLVKDVRDMPPSSGDLIWSPDLSLCSHLGCAGSISACYRGWEHFEHGTSAQMLSIHENR